MKIRRFLAACAVLGLSLASPVSSAAQVPDPQVVGGSVSISTELRADLEAYLASDPPSVASFYAPTFVQNSGPYTLVSLAGLNIQAAEDPWFIEGSDEHDSNVIWVGTVRINEDGSGSMFSHRTAMQLPKLAIALEKAIRFGAGGGSYVRLPFQTGRSMMYGVRGIHGAGDFGTSGMRAIDLVGGNALGSNVASSTVYASFTGTVDFVCVDDYQAAVRTYNDSTDDYFLYAHMFDNATLELDHVFTTGSTIGTLRPGTFSDDCGWTEQDDNVYHDHWMFEPAGGGFRVGAYTITESDGKIHAGDRVYGTGSWIVNTNTLTGGDDPGSQTGAAPSFWDSVVGGIVRAAGSLAAILPSPMSVSLLHTVTNTIILFFKLTWVLLRPNSNLAFFFVVVSTAITIKLTFATPQLVFTIVRMVRVIKQSFNPQG